MKEGYLIRVGLDTQRFVDSQDLEQVRKLTISDTLLLSTQAVRMCCQVRREEFLRWIHLAWAIHMGTEPQLCIWSALTDTKCAVYRFLVMPRLAFGQRHKTGREVEMGVRVNGVNDDDDVNIL